MAGKGGRQTGSTFNQAPLPAPQAAMFSPKLLPPDDSWWTHCDRETFVRRAEQEAERMSRSRIGHSIQTGTRHAGSFA